jgi:hypothetical protein
MTDFDAMLDAMLDAMPNAAEEIDALRAKVHNEGPSEPESGAEDEAEGGEPAMPGFKPIPPDMQDEEETEEEDEEAMY